MIHLALLIHLTGSLCTISNGISLGSNDSVKPYDFLTSNNKAVVKGINIFKKHQKPSKQSGGGIIEKELPIHLSNLSMISKKDNKRTKIGYKIENNKKQRFEKRTGDIIK